jgi:hypothetical protein
VLCSIPDAHAALIELRQALRSGGELRFLEHVRGQGTKARVQKLVDRSGLWRGIAGGCNCSRDTVAAVRAAGFEVSRVRSVNVGPAWGPTNPHVLGVAVR